MASLSSFFFSFLLLLLLLLFALVGQCSQEQFDTFHTISIQSLLPRNVCSSSEGPPSPPSLGRESLKVAHLHGPCSPLHRQQNVDHKQILDNDQSRVNAMHRRVSANSQRAKPRDPLVSSAIPAHTGDSLDTGNYIVTIGFGSPKRDQSVIFDTGSDVTWIQCKPCVASCYQQQEPIFDPSQSSTYANISCSSPYCSELDMSGCTSSTCVYGVQYGDSSYTAGFFSEDTLTLTSSDVLRNFRFGCGERNEGLFGKAAGLLGLGREKVSMVSQSFQRYGGVFAYCLPSTSSSTGYLTFGGDSPYSNVKTTPMLDTSTPTYYFLDLVAIYVAGRRLSIPSTVFSNAGTIIDSGTVISRLPPAAYSALRSAFRKAMSRYKSAPAISILDTCYDFTGVDKVSPPAVALQFGSGIITNLDPSGILYAASESQTCLAFAGNDDATELSIIGNAQQRKFNVVYDVSKKVIGFGPNGC